MEKTCGNCGHGCYESTVYCEVFNNDMLVNCEACDDWIESKKQHRRCDNITQLEQRYAQLAEVARNMYDWCDGVINRFYTIVPERVDGFRKQLEELGVEL